LVVPRRPLVHRESPSVLRRRRLFWFVACPPGPLPCVSPLVRRHRRERQHKARPSKLVIRVRLATGGDDLNVHRPAQGADSTLGHHQSPRIFLCTRSRRNAHVSCSAFASLEDSDRVTALSTFLPSGLHCDVVHPSYSSPPVSG